MDSYRFTILKLNPTIVFMVPLAYKFRIVFFPLFKKPFS